MKRDTNLYAMVLAGGSGTRFWPLSRPEMPKQFLSIFAGRSLFQMTLARVRKLVPASRILVVTNQNFYSLVLRQGKAWGLKSSNVLLEPQGKNTAPAICWAASWIQERDKDAVMAVLPSDHLVADTSAFVKVLKQAVSLAQEDFLVTLGIVPTRPETGYGYLKVVRARQGNRAFYKVAKFVEKPDLARAKKFLRLGNYLWNSGMFVWRVEKILAEYQKYLPMIRRAFVADCRNAAVKKIWPGLPSISVDYGILEKATQVVTVPARAIGWSDVGSWQALAEVLPQDQQQNTNKGKVFTLDCNRNLIWGGKRLIAGIGLKDLVIVDTDDALLVCRKEYSQRVREVAKLL